MTIQAFYQSIQGDHAEALRRFLTEDRLYRAVKSFPLDESYAKLMEAVEKGDISAGFACAHKLKGIAGILAFTPLYRALCELSEQLRAQSVPAAPALIERVRFFYRSVTTEIEQLEGGED